VTPRVLETGCEWTAAQVDDPTAWTEVLTDAEIAEIDAAVAHARSVSDDLLDIAKPDFPLPTLGKRLEAIEQTLINGRGFVRIRGLPRERYSNDDMCLAYWGIGAHLGKPWPQNKHGHLLGDVTDQNKAPDFHCDGSDLVGLMCLKTGVSGGLSAVCNSVAIHNALVRERPDLAAELYKPQPFDARGEQGPGRPGWYSLPVFSEMDDRLFVRLIAPYIHASQRHADAPRLTDKAKEALAWILEASESGRYSVFMDFRPGDMQFINNFHVLHGRTAYEDDRAAGKIRHLKRLWLETEALAERPAWFRNTVSDHWGQKKVISRLDAAI
jgi:Taurine catabolism dioxygenase TauD, TfdA family